MPKTNNSSAQFVTDHISIKTPADCVVYYIGDVHWSGKKPRMRKDNYYVEVKGLLMQVADLVSKETLPTVVIFGGDLGHRPHWTNKQIRDFLIMFSTFRKNIRVMVVPGNHDLWGYQITSIPELSLGVLEMSDIVIPRGIEIHRVNNTRIVSVPESTTMDDISLIDPEPGCCYIVAAHQAVGKEKTPYCVAYTDIETPPWADVVLFSHIHTPFGPYKNPHGTVYINPGPIGRRNLKEKDVHPSIIRIENDKLQILPLKALPGDDVFDVKRITAHHQERQRVVSVAGNIAKKLKAMDLPAQIQEVAALGHYSPAAVEVMISFLEGVDTDG